MSEQEQRPKSRKRGLFIVGVLLLVLLLVVAFFLPWLLKRYIEANSEAWIHRKVRIERIILNPFTFTYSVNGVTVNEPGSEAVFVSWRKIEVKADLWKAFRNNDWRFHHLRLVEPYVHIAQHGDRFNFSDLLELGGETAPAPDAEPVRFSMEDIQLTDGRVVYAADLLKEPAEVVGLNATCNRITGESTRMDFGLSFALAKGGALKGGFMIDTERSVYAIDAELARFALPQLLPYLQDLMRSTALTGEVDLDLHLRDSWAASDGLAVRAALGLRDVGVTDAEGEPLVGLRSARVRLDTLDAKSDNFDLASVAVDGFTTRFRMWPDGSHTWSKALKLDTTATGGDTTAVLTASSDNVFVMLADYVRMLGRDLVASEYNADSLAITNAELVFEDFTPERPFRYALNGLAVHSSRMNSGEDSLRLSASAMLNGRGTLASAFAFDPKNLKNVESVIAVKDLALADLDAYGRWYAAHPLEAGMLNYSGRTRIADGQLNSANHIQVHGMELGRKTDAHDPGIVVLPLRLGVSLLKDVKGNIDLDVPVEGDINDPRFKPWPIVWKVLKNLVVKAATAPGRMLVRAVGGGDDADLECVRFAPLQAALGKDQRRTLEQLAKGLVAKPGLTVALVPVVDEREEMEELAAFEVKKTFLGYAGVLAAVDSARIHGLSTRDSSFVGYLNERSPGTVGQGERQRCVAIVGAEPLKTRCAELEWARQAAVRDFLRAQGLTDGRFVLRPGMAEEARGYQGKPGYRFIFDAEKKTPAVGAGPNAP